MRVSNSSDLNGMFGKSHMPETRAKIGQANQAYTGRRNKKSKAVRLISPEGKAFVLYGKSELKQFCDTNKLSLASFQSSLLYDWPPARRGMNRGWSILRIIDKDVEPRDHSLF